MIRLSNITQAVHQRHTMAFEESEVIVTLRYHPTIGVWAFDAEYKDARVFGRKLSVGVLHMVSRNLPFDFLVTANAGSDLDPIRLDDFATDRCSLYMLEAGDMEAVRGAPVPI